MATVACHGNGKNVKKIKVLKVLTARGLGDFVLAS